MWEALRGIKQRSDVICFMFEKITLGTMYTADPRKAGAEAGQPVKRLLCHPRMEDVSSSDRDSSQCRREESELASL